MIKKLLNPIYHSHSAPLNPNNLPQPIPHFEENQYFKRLSGEPEAVLDLSRGGT
jgi:hypothetical protein